MKSSQRLTVKATDTSRLVPVANMNKIHTTHITANRNLIAYSSSKKGMIRVICQEDASRLVLDTNEYGSCVAMDVTTTNPSPSTSGATSTLAVACDNGLLLWSLPHQKLKLEEIAGPRVVPLHSSTSVTGLKFEPGSSNLVLSCSHGADEADVFVLDTSAVQKREEEKGVDGHSAAEEADVRVVSSTQFSSKIVSFDFFPDDVSRAAVLTSDGQVLCCDFSLGNSSPIVTVNSEEIGPLKGIECVSNDGVVVVGTNGVILYVGQQAVDTMRLESKICKGRYFAPWLVTAMEGGQIVITKIQDNSIVGASCLDVKLDIKDLCITENLGRESNVAFEAYLFHASGVSILSVIDSDLPGKVSTALSNTPPQGPSAASSLTSSSPPPPPIPKKGKKKTSQQAANQPSQNQPLAESYSRNDIQEKTYYLHELLSSGMFVTKETFDEAQRTYKQDIRRLEQRIAKLSELLNKKERQQNQKEKQKSHKREKASQQLSLTEDEEFPSLPNNLREESRQSPLANETRLTTSTSPLIKESLSSHWEPVGPQLKGESLFEQKVGEESRIEQEPEHEQEQREPEPLFAASSPLGSPQRPTPSTLSPIVGSQAPGIPVSSPLAALGSTGVTSPLVSTISPLTSSPTSTTSNFQTFIEQLVDHCTEKAELQSQLTEFAETHDVSELNNLDPNMENYQLLILSAVALMSLGMTTDNGPKVHEWIIHIANKLKVDQFTTNKGLLVSVLNQAKNNIKALGSQDYVNQTVRGIQQLVFSAY